MTKIRTYTGLMLDFKSPQPESICIEDIAHALSLEGRWGNHSKRRYSVAEHSIQISYLSDNPKEAFAHDFTEAYMRDVPAPLKSLLPDYQKIETRLQEVIFEKFGLSGIPDEVHMWDKELARQEWENVVVTDNWTTLSFLAAKKEFKKRFYELFGNHQDW